MSATDGNGTQGQPAAMQLDQVPMDPGGGGDNNGGLQGPSLFAPSLASSPEAKKKAANSIELHIAPDTRKAGDTADESTGAAVKAFGPKDAGGWVTSGALKSAHEKWNGQVRALLDRLEAEKKALRATNTVLGGTDGQVGTDTTLIPSPFNGY
ncbi:MULTISPECIES: hypothetical protein [unclassified Streptomyces]|uniref:hypothetical protein n=1 Tax=unclassified Streptomyces TaxID=2593676 RepID=UPI00364F429D